MIPIMRRLAVITLALTLVAYAQKPRARDLGIPFDGTPGRNNAITDVAGVGVGHTTLISGSGKLVVGKGPVRTGVTAIHPRGKASNDAVFGAWGSLARRTGSARRLRAGCCTFGCHSHCARLR